MNNWQKAFFATTNTEWYDDQVKYRYWLECQLDKMLDVITDGNDMPELQKILKKAGQEVEAKVSSNVIDLKGIVPEKVKP